MQGVEYYTFRRNGLAKRFKNSTITKDILSISDIMGLVLTSVNKGNMTKAQKDSLSRGGIGYNFKFKTPINNEIKKIVINIPSHLVEEYAKEIEHLDALTAVSNKITRINFVKIAALTTASIVLVSFASVKISEYGAKAYEAQEKYESEKRSHYFDSIGGGHRLTDEDIKKGEEEYIADLLKRAQNGDPAAKEEYNKYIMEHVAENMFENNNVKK